MTTVSTIRSKPGTRLGLRIKASEVRGFIRKVASALQKALEQKFVEPRSSDRGSYDLHYFTTNPPIVLPSELGDVPCIPAESSHRMWIAVEIRIGRTGNDNKKLSEHFLEHISIKSYEGEPNYSGKLLFRAEWDARDSGLTHAQPHWNIHPDSRSPATQAAGFQAYVERESSLGFSRWTEPGAIQSSPAGVPEFERIRMHFALASTWQHTSGTHSCELRSVDDATRWIGGCCTYLKLQFAFLDGVLPRNAN